MSALPLTLTTAGRDALINAQNTGASNVVISQIGLSATTMAPTAETVAIPDEIKRLGGVGGQVVAPETFYVAATDTSADTYSVRTIALYLSTGVLFGVYSQAAVLLEKASAALAVIEASVRLAEPLAVEIEFTGGGWNNPPASEAVEGIIALATQAEVNAGTNFWKAVTPARLKARLDALLAGKSDVGHTHDAGHVVSGVFAVARIPDLALAKVVGLVDALAGKAASAHTHLMSEVTGLVAALDAKLAIATFTWANLPGKPNVAVLGADAAFANLTANGSAVRTVATLPDPATLSGGQTFTGKKTFKSTLPGGLAAQDWAAEPFEVQAKETGTAAALAFHIPEQIAEKFGLDSDGVWKVTLAGAARTLWHSGNFDPASKAAAIHTHDWAQVTGKPNLAVQGQDATFRDLRASRGDVSGVIYLGNQSLGDRYLFVDVVGNYSLPGAPLFVGGRIFSEGSEVWSPYNFTPSTKSNVGHGHAWTEITSRPAWTDPNAVATNFEQKAFRVKGEATVANGTTVGHSLEVTAFGAGAAFMAFHRPGSFATFLGLDTDNELKWGGWSNAQAWRVHHDGNQPVGELKLFDGTSPPAGARVLVAEGQAVSRTTYAKLFAHYGTRYGAGDGATTFNLPDWRGVFFRGLDRGRGLDPDRVLGDLQLSQNKLHTHPVPEGERQANSSTFTGYASGDDYTNLTGGFSTSGFEGGAEARPVNQALLACVTY